MSGSKSTRQVKVNALSRWTWVQLNAFDHIIYQPIGVVVKEIAIGARGLEFNSQAGQIWHSVANGFPTLRRSFTAQAQTCGDVSRHSSHASA